MASLSAACIAAACGGGSGGGGSSDADHPADIGVTVDPNAIDTGDRLTVDVHISSINEQGIALKIRVPKELSYISESSAYLVDDLRLDTGPDRNVTEGDVTYLVYFIQRSTVGGSDRAILTLKLQPTANIPRGNIDVDADLDDPEIANAREFDPKNPKFDVVDQEIIRVGPAATAAPTSRAG